MELIYNKLNEVWTTISINGLEFLNEYKISNYGRVMQYNKLKKINFDGKSLPSYRFCCDYKDMHISAQKLTMMAFSYRPDYKDHSVIVFDGNCELRDISFIPDGTFVIKPHRLDDVLDMIFENEDAEYTDKREVMRILKSAVENGNNTDTQTEHVENIKDMSHYSKVALL